MLCVRYGRWRRRTRSTSSSSTHLTPRPRGNVDDGAVYVIHTELERDCAHKKTSAVDPSVLRGCGRPLVRRYLADAVFVVKIPALVGALAVGGLTIAEHPGINLLLLVGEEGGKSDHRRSRWAHGTRAELPGLGGVGLLSCPRGPRRPEPGARSAAEGTGLRRRAEPGAPRTAEGTGHHTLGILGHDRARALPGDRSQNEQRGRGLHV